MTKRAETKRTCYGNRQVERVALERSLSSFVDTLQNDETKIATPVEGVLRRKSFYFQQRTGKLDIRAIGRVDVDRVVHEVDIDTLQVGASCRYDRLFLYSSHIKVVPSRRPRNSAISR